MAGSFGVERLERVGSNREVTVKGQDDDANKRIDQLPYQVCRVI